MKKLVIEEEHEGFDLLLGEWVEVWCLNYIYAGKLVGVNDSFIKLKPAFVVYETGELTASNYKDAQQHPGSRYLNRATIESWLVTTKISA